MKWIYLGHQKNMKTCKFIWNSQNYKNIQKCATSKRHYAVFATIDNLKKLERKTRQSQLAKSIVIFLFLFMSFQWKQHLRSAEGFAFEHR